jgi:hypothetical protein
MAHRGLRILILDDEDYRHKAFDKRFIGNVVHHANTVAQAIDMLKKTKYDSVYLDHDLNGQQMVPSGPGTGYEVAQWLCRHPDRCPLYVYVHSFNAEGARNIKEKLPGAILRPGIWAEGK